MFRVDPEDDSKCPFLPDKGNLENEDIEASASETTKAPSIESFGASFEISRQPTDVNRSSDSSYAHFSRDWIRWSVIVILQGIIIFLLICPGPRELNNCKLSGVKDFVETGGDINGLYNTREP